MNFILLNVIKWIVGLPFAIPYSIWRLIQYFIMLKDITNDEFCWPNEWQWTEHD